MAVAEQNTVTLAQKIADATLLSPEAFLAKYGISQRDFKKENNIK